MFIKLLFCSVACCEAVRSAILATAWLLVLIKRQIYSGNTINTLILSGTIVSVRYSQCKEAKHRRRISQPLISTNGRALNEVFKLQTDRRRSYLYKAAYGRTDSWVIVWGFLSLAIISSFGIMFYVFSMFVRFSFCLCRKTLKKLMKVLGPVVELRGGPRGPGPP